MIGNQIELALKLSEGALIMGTTQAKLPGVNKREHAETCLLTSIYSGRTPIISQIMEKEQGLVKKRKQPSRARCIGSVGTVVPKAWPQIYPLDK